MVKIIFKKTSLWRFLLIDVLLVTFLFYLLFYNSKALHHGITLGVFIGYITILIILYFLKNLKLIFKDKNFIKSKH